MKTYSVLYAQDVPHYAYAEIQARGPKDALAKARKFETDIATSYEPDWDSSVSRRIVHIEAPNGKIVAEDIPLDQYHLRNGGDPDRRLCDAAAAMLAAPEALIEKSDNLEAAIAGATDQFEDEVSRLSEAASAAEKIVKTARGQS
jgi:hypothetical protein